MNSGRSSSRSEVRYWRAERIDLRLTAFVEKDEVWLELVNAGRRPVRIKSIHVCTSDGEERAIAYREDLFPLTLEEHQARALSASSSFEPKQGGPLVTGFYARDTVGTRWPLAHPDFLRVQSELRAALERKREALRAAPKPLPPAEAIAKIDEILKYLEGK